MSHFVRVRTQIRERESLVAALRDLHYDYQEAKAGERLVVRGFAGNEARAEVVVATGSKYDIGFERQAESYEVVADWWGVEGNTKIRQEEFVRQVNRQYAYNLIHAQAREQNLIVEEERVTESGDLVITLSERG